MPTLVALALSLASLVPVGISLPPLPIAALPAHEPPVLTAASWALYSLDQGAFVWASDLDEARAPASVTKLMTALVVVDQGIDLTDEVTISARAANEGIGYEGQLKLYQGEIWTVQDLLEDMLVYSDNGAAIALAEHTAGSVEAFVALMNQKAADLGMAGTHFANPNGLDEDGHMSSARDLVRLGVACVAQPAITRVTRVKSATFTPGGRIMPVRNTNRLLGTFPGVLGLKTGDTINAGEVLLSYAVLGHEEYVGVVMGSSDHMYESALLLAYATRILGPQDYFYASGADLDQVAAWPEWRRARLAAAGLLDNGQRADIPMPLSPAQRTAATALRDLLPALLGGEGQP
jgi:serine-type D-Ala-D-Ala carboxypeptidase (penicillin-binding protein 5/6)